MFFLNSCSLSCFPPRTIVRQPSSVVRPINELVSEFWLESRSDGMVDYVCFRLIDIAAQKSIGALVQRIWSCWDEFAYPIRVCDRFEVDGRLLLPAY